MLGGRVGGLGVEPNQRTRMHTFSLLSSQINLPPCFLLYPSTPGLCVGLTYLTGKKIKLNQKYLYSTKWQRFQLVLRIYKADLFLSPQVSYNLVLKKQKKISNYTPVWWTMKTHSKHAVVKCVYKNMHCSSLKSKI